VEESEWYDEATASRCEWRSTCRQRVEWHQETRCHQWATKPKSQQYECKVCHGRFRRDSDRKRHKCMSERRKPVQQRKGAACVCVFVSEKSKPVQQQRGVVQCQACSRWFRSKGSLGLHDS
jgi:hypothetical protein